MSKYIRLIGEFTEFSVIQQAYSGSPDPKDDYLFALCLQHKAILVTGDKILQRYAQSPVHVISTTSLKELF